MEDSHTGRLLYVKILISFNCKITYSVPSAQFLFAPSARKGLLFGFRM